MLKGSLGYIRTGWFTKLYLLFKGLLDQGLLGSVACTRQAETRTQKLGSHPVEYCPYRKFWSELERFGTFWCRPFCSARAVRVFYCESAASANCRNKDRRPGLATVACQACISLLTLDTLTFILTRTFKLFTIKHNLFSVSCGLLVCQAFHKESSGNAK